MTQTQLNKLREVWQKRLRLQDWDVSVAFAPRSEVEGDGVTYFKSRLMAADIKICTEATATPQTGGQTYTPEQVLIHELLHLYFGALRDLKGEKEIALEAAIDRTAWALYTLSKNI